MTDLLAKQSYFKIHNAMHLLNHLLHLRPLPA